MPVRTVPKSYRNLTGVAAAGKAVGEAQFESTLERDFLAVLDFSPDVERFEVQPIKIEWRGEDGRLCSYTPDVLVEFRPYLNRPPWLCEVKYRADLKKNWTELHPKFLRAIRYAKERGWRFRLISEIEVRTPYLTNVRFLAPFRIRGFPDSDIARLLGALGALGRTTPADVMQTLSLDAHRQAEWLPLLWHLIATHRIGTELERELRMDSVIWSAS